jgi:phospholipid/cholesterol/gamma-HCH transport system substrate-binding protein
VTEGGRFRYANEAVGALVLGALAVFFVAVLQGGVLRQWFNPTQTLRIVLPEQGLFGLAQGAPIEILGTKAGEVRRIVIDPGKSFYAEADIDAGMSSFVRRDSRAFIRKQFGIAGAAYLEITRGQGEPLDWGYAVITAEVDRAPTENVGQLIDDLRAKVFPIIDETNRAVTALANLADAMQSPDGDLRRLLASMQTIAGRIERGEGAVGRLLADDSLVRDLEKTLASANGLVGQMRPILADLQNVSRDVSALSGAMSQQSKAVPGLVEDAGATVASLRAIARDLSQTSPGLPALLAQTQQTTLELERLLLQLRSHWLLGGSETAVGGEAAGARLSPQEIRP